MNINMLPFATLGVIKGSVLGGGSTSETLAYGFVSGDLKAFDGSYQKFTDAWDRLDSGQRDAVIELRELVWCGLSWIQEEWTQDNFVNGFIKWKRRKLVLDREQKFWDKQPRWTEIEELPESEQRMCEQYADRKLKPHL